METVDGQNISKTYFSTYTCRCTTALFLFLLCLFSIEYILSGILYETDLHFLQRARSVNIFVNNDTLSEINNEGNQSIAGQNISKKDDMKIILRYKMHPRIHYEESILNCGKYICKITPDVKVLKNATAILFNPLYSPLPEYRSKEQYWVMYYREASSRFPAKKWHEGKFNLIMSYHRRVGDLYAPYVMTYKGDGTPKDIANVKGPLIDNIPRGQVQCLPRQNETGTNTVTNVLWYSSNCRIKHRAKYVAEMSKYAIRVDHFGKCGKPDPCAKGQNKGKHKQIRDGACLARVAAKYKFYLGFENSVCQDYITGQYYFQLCLMHTLHRKSSFTLTRKS